MHRCIFLSSAFLFFFRRTGLLGTFQTSSPLPPGVYREIIENHHKCHKQHNKKKKMKTYLNVLFGDEPWPVSQNLIDFIEIPQFGRNRMQTVKPTLVSANRKEFTHLLLNQVRTLMTTSSLFFKINKFKNVFFFVFFK